MARIIIVASFAESLINFRGPLIRKLVSEGHEVITIAPQASEEVKACLKVLGAKYHDFSIDRRGLNPSNDLKSLIALTIFFKRIKPDVVLLYTIKPVIYGSIAAFLAKVPIISSVITGLGYTFNTSSGKTTALNRLVVFLYKIALKSNIIVFFQNPDDLSLFRENSIIGNKTDGIVLNGSGVDINHFKMETVPQEISFLLIARLIKEKGVLEYIEAARVIKAMHPEIRFRLVGWIENGPNAFKKADIDAWAAEGTIDYLGKLGDVRESIAKSAVYVLPSYREGTPRTVLEAMAMGRPIITTDAPGCRETVCHGFNGFLVPIQDITALVEAMKVFIRTPDQIEVMGKRSRMMVVEKYDVNKINQKMTGNLSVACIDKNIGL